MNRICALLLCGLFALPTIANAQEPALFPKVRVNAGIKLGANLAKLDGQTWDGGYKTNVLGGVFIRLHNGRWGVQAEGLFSQSEYTTGKDFNAIYPLYLQAGKDSLSRGSFKVSYFNIPLMVQLKILNRVWMQLGAQYSGVVSVKDEDEFVKDAEGLFDHGDISAVGGLWVDLPLHLNAGARYVLGFTNSKNDELNKTATESWKQRNVQIHIGWTIF